jgi:AcrR family transcriptional regulator
MSGQVKRRYDASRRQESAAATRGAVLTAARELFAERGYQKTTMKHVAERAGVALDTVYATTGRKPALFRELIETALSGTDHAIPAQQRAYVRAIREAPDAATKISIYAGALRDVHARLAPLLRVARTAADPEVEELWEGIAHRRAVNMREFAADLAATGQLRPELSLDEVADMIWATNSPEFYCLLVQDRGWPPPRYEAWLTDCWQRLLLVPRGAPDLAAH